MRNGTLLPPKQPLNPWIVVGASAFSLTLGAGTVLLYSSGMFMGAVTRDLGISRGLFAGGLLAGSVVAAFSCIVVGMLIDRFGPRIVILCGIPLFAAVNAAFSLMTASPLTILLLFSLSGLVSPSHSPLTYGSLIVRWFDRRQGLALGIAITGSGIGVMVLPPILGYLIGTFGWRAAYAALGAGILVFSWIPALLFVKEAPPRAAQEEEAVPRPTGEFSDILTRHFFLLLVAVMCAIPAISGVLAHAIVMLTDRGVDARTATLSLSSAGAFIIIGRICSGWLLDRTFAPVLAAGMFSLPLLGVLLLATQYGGATPLIAIILVAFCAGAEIDLMGYLVARYFHASIYGRAFGALFVAFSAANGIGPYLAGIAFDHFGNYQAALLAFAAGLAVACASLLMLGRYIYPPRSAIDGLEPLPG